MNQIESLCLIYLTTPDLNSARQITSELLKKNLIACSNIVTAPIESHFVWKESLESSQEFQVWLKSRSEHFDQVRSVVIDLHPYECPALIQIAISNGDPSFLNWIQHQTSNPKVED